MLPTLQGVIARRVLLNFRADPAVAQRFIPAPLRVQRQNGAIVGVCLIRFEQLRPKGMPAAVGLSSENMAHRIAVEFPTSEGWKPGVFIWRRETNQSLIRLFGGRLFPGVHGDARFRVREGENAFDMEVRTPRAEADVVFTSRPADWRATPAFSTLEEASEFFRRGDCGFSCSSDGNRLEGLQLRSIRWEMQPLHVEIQEIPFYTSRFPEGSFEFDCGLLMRRLPHEWRELKDVPQLERTVTLSS